MFSIFFSFSFIPNKTYYLIDVTASKWFSICLKNLEYFLSNIGCKRNEGEVGQDWRFNELLAAINNEELFTLFHSESFYRL